MVNVAKDVREEMESYCGQHFLKDLEMQRRQVDGAL